MTRLHLVVEGQSEERFVSGLLRAHLAALGVYADARRVETGRDKRSSRIYRGGLPEYARVKKDLSRWMRQDDHPEVFFSTMFDLFALPCDFPQYEAARGEADPYRRVAALELAFAQDISHRRFIPYIQLHEFEALLLSDPARFEVEFADCSEAIDGLRRMAGAFRSPELIDDGQETAPSKRIIKELPDYAGRKASAGPVIAKAIGLEKMKAKCVHFREWLVKLERLGGE